MNAWFGSFGSTAIPETNRPGVDGLSMRVKSTAAGAAPAFLVTQRRPRRVPAHSVPVSEGARVVATTYAPGRLPKSCEVSFWPIGTQSPQVGRFGLKYTVLQSWDLRYASDPPLSFVRHTC